MEPEQIIKDYHNTKYKLEIRKRGYKDLTPAEKEGKKIKYDRKEKEL